MTDNRILQEVSAGIDRERDIALAYRKSHRHSERAQASERELERVSQEHNSEHNRIIGELVGSVDLSTFDNAVQAIGEITALTTLDVDFAGKQSEEYGRLFEDANTMSGERVLLLGRSDLHYVPEGHVVDDIPLRSGLESRIVSGRLTIVNPSADIKITPNDQYQYPVEKQSPNLFLGEILDRVIDPVDKYRGKGIYPHTAVHIRGGRFAVSMAIETPVISDEEVIFEYLNDALMSGNYGYQDLPQVLVTGQAPIGEALKWLYRNRTSGLLSDLDILAIGALHGVPSYAIADGDESRHRADMTTRAEGKILIHINNGAKREDNSGFSELPVGPNARSEDPDITTVPVDVEAYLSASRYFDKDAAEFKKEIQAAAEAGMLEIVDGFTGDLFADQINRPLRNYMSSARKFLVKEDLGDIPNSSIIMARAYEEVLAKYRKGEIKMSGKTRKAIISLLDEYIERI